VEELPDQIFQLRRTDLGPGGPGTLEDVLECFEEHIQAILQHLAAQERALHQCLVGLEHVARFVLANYRGNVVYQTQLLGRYLIGQSLAGCWNGVAWWHGPVSLFDRNDNYRHGPPETVAFQSPWPRS